MTIPEAFRSEETAITPRMRELLYDLKRAAQALESHYGRCKEMIKAVVDQGRADGIVDLQIRQLIDKNLIGIVSERSIQRYMPKELRLYNKNPPGSHLADKNQLEQTSTSTESESDDIDETHDARSENQINDEVKASMSASAYKMQDYQTQKEENKIRLELKQDIEALRQELDQKNAQIELFNAELEDSKNQKFEERLLNAEEINKQLRIENEQLRHALTKHSFENAADVKDKQKDPQEIENLTNYIKQLEDINSDRYKQIQELNQKIESFSHIDRVVEHQPLELDLSDKGGFLGRFFSYRGRKVRVLHDGTKVTSIALGGIK